MNLYLWYSVSDLTDSYHSSGGLVVVAPTLERARELIAEPYCLGAWHGSAGHDCNGHPQRSRSDCEAMTEAPDVVMALAGEQPEHVYIFPDAGCC